MKQTCSMRQMLAGVFVFFIMNTVQAHKPVWTFEPVPGYSNSISINPTESKTIEYTVINQSHKKHHLKMTPIQGITASGCTSTLDYHQPCTLTLQINGSQLSGAVTGGPVLCEQGNANQCYQPSQGDELRIVLVKKVFTVTANGDVNVTPSPLTQQVNYGERAVITLTAAHGYAAVITSDTCGGRLIGPKYISSAVTANCSVQFGSIPVFPVAAGPGNVIAVAGNGEVTVSWTAPTNTGTGTITGYKVTYGRTDEVAFTKLGCISVGSPPTTSCKVRGLDNEMAYTFAVTTTTTLNGASETGPAAFSSSVTPTARVLIANPPRLALSGLGGGATRTMSITNNTANPVIISSITIFPDFPSGTNISGTDCLIGAPLNGHTSCTITIHPGATVSSGVHNAVCTKGIAPIPSVVTVKDTSGNKVSTEVAVLGYGCRYQGGYLFSIDDSFPEGSLGGKVFATAEQGTNNAWYPAYLGFDSIWGIDDSSTSTNPSPNELSSEPASLQLGQLNCDAVNDGACATENLFVYYGAETNYAAGICRQPLNGTGRVCTGGGHCYTDWYVPSICDLGPFGSTGLESGNYPHLSGSQSCVAGSTNIENKLVSTGIVTPAPTSDYYWSSTEASNFTQTNGWEQRFEANYQLDHGKGNQNNVRCARGLTK